MLGAAVPRCCCPEFSSRLYRYEMEKQQLPQLLSYQNEDILSRFLDMYEVDQEEARDIFQETKKFLYLSRQPGVFIPDDLLIIDEMWHNFILFTPEYHQFCQTYFNAYLHHIPASKEEKTRRQLARKADMEAFKQEHLMKLGELMSLTYDHLGKETVVKWFQVYPEKYSVNAIKSLRK